MSGSSDTASGGVNKFNWSYLVVGGLAFAGAYSLYPAGMAFGERVSKGDAAVGIFFGCCALVAKGSLSINAWHKLLFDSPESSGCASFLGYYSLGLLTVLPVWVTGYLIMEEKYPHREGWNLFLSIAPNLLVAGIYADVIGGFVHGAKKARASGFQNSLDWTIVVGGFFAVVAAAGSFSITFRYFDHLLGTKNVPAALSFIVSCFIAIVPVISRVLLAGRSCKNFLGYFQKSKSSDVDLLSPDEQAVAGTLKEGGASRKNIISIVMGVIGVVGAGAFTEVVLRGAHAANDPEWLLYLFSITAYLVVAVLNGDATTKLGAKFWQGISSS